MITVVLGVEAVDGDPYARFVATSSLMNYVVRTFVSSIVVKEGDPYGKSKGNYHGWEVRDCFSCCKKRLLYRRKTRQSTEPKNSNSRALKNHSGHLSEQAPLLGKLHYTDPDKIGRGYLEDRGQRSIW